jgi:hypothetical protein
VTSAGAPPRPDEVRAQARRERRWGPLLAVLAVIAVLTLGARGVEGAAASPIAIDGVRIRPAPGWAQEQRTDEDGVHRLWLRKGVAGLFVVAIEGLGGTPEALAADYVRRGLGGEYARVTTGGLEGAALPGVRAVRFGYVGVTGEGVTVEGVVVVAVVPGGTGVVFDGFAPQGELAAVVGELRSMIETAVLR